MIIYWVRAERGTVTVKRRHQDEHGSSGGGDRLRRCGGERSLIRKESQAALVKRLGFDQTRPTAPANLKARCGFWWCSDVSVWMCTAERDSILWLCMIQRAVMGSILKLSHPAEDLRTGNNRKPGRLGLTCHSPKVRDNPGSCGASRHSGNEKRVLVLKKKKRGSAKAKRTPPSAAEQIRSTENNRSWPSLSTAHRWRAPRAEVPGMCLDTDSCTPPITVLMLRRAWKSKDRPSIHLTIPHCCGLVPLLCPFWRTWERQSKNIRYPVGNMVRESQEWWEDLLSTLHTSLSTDTPGGHHTPVQCRLNTSKNECSER